MVERISPSFCEKCCGFDEPLVAPVKLAFKYGKASSMIGFRNQQMVASGGYLFERLFRLPSRKQKCGDENIGVEDDSHLAR